MMKKKRSGNGFQERRPLWERGRIGVKAGSVDHFSPCAFAVRKVCRRGAEEKMSNNCCRQA